MSLKSAHTTMKTDPGKALASLAEPCRSMQSALCLCKLFPPFASVARLCCVRGLQQIKNQHVRRVRCGRKPICWGRVHAQVRLCIPTAVARPVHLMLRLSFVCYSPANAADVGSSPAQAVSVTFLFGSKLILLLIWTDLSFVLQRSKGSVQTLRALTVKQIYEVECAAAANSALAGL